MENDDDDDHNDDDDGITTTDKNNGNTYNAFYVWGIDFERITYAISFHSHISHIRLELLLSFLFS